MKKLHLLALLLFITTSVFAQKPNNKTVNFDYTQLPLKPLSEEVKTYSSEVRNISINYPIETSTFYSKLKLDGYERAEKGESDAHISFTIRNATYKTSFEKKTYSKKISETESVTKTGGIYKVTATVLLEGYFRCPKDDIYKTMTIGTKTKTYTSNRYDTYSAAVSASYERKDADAQKLYTEIVNSKLAEWNSEVNSQYGYSNKSRSASLMRGKGKHDYSKLENAFESVNEQLVFKRKDQPTPNFNQVVLGAIQSWESAESQYKADDKKAKIGDKNIVDLYRTLAYCYLMVEDYENMKKYAELFENKRLSFKKGGKLSQQVAQISDEAKSEVTSGSTYDFFKNIYLRYLANN